MELDNSYESRKESNRVVEEATRKKGILIFTFEKNMHKIDISKKEYENIEIEVENYGVGYSRIYRFKLEDIYELKGEFRNLVNEYTNFRDNIVIRYVNKFTFEKFVGEELEEKETKEYEERESFYTNERINSIYYKVIG